MPSTVIFSSALPSNGVVLGQSQVVTQNSGLVEVTCDYIVRTADLPRIIARFYLDAPPPVFPSSVISPRNLQDGKLFMVSHTVNNQYGVATISARFAGVSSRAVAPFKTFEYVNFSVSRPIYVSLSLDFGSMSYIKNKSAGDVNNDFRQNYAATVPFSGRIEQIKYTFATLSKNAEASLPPAPSIAEAISDIEAGQISRRPGGGDEGFVGNFGGERTLTLNTGPGTPPGGEYVFTDPPNFSGQQVMDKVSAANGLGMFFTLTPKEWKDRGVEPQGYFSLEKETEAVTPSVYIREIIYVPRVTSGLG